MGQRKAKLVDAVLKSRQPLGNTTRSKFVTSEQLQFLPEEKQSNGTAIAENIRLDDQMQSQ